MDHLPELPTLPPATTPTTAPSAALRDNEIYDGRGDRTRAERDAASSAELLRRLIEHHSDRDDPQVSRECVPHRPHD
jgi:hypothetical protein